jgi:hypothetical protein
LTLNNVLTKDLCYLFGMLNRCRSISSISRGFLAELVADLKLSGREDRGIACSESDSQQSPLDQFRTSIGCIRSSVPEWFRTLESDSRRAHKVSVSIESGSWSGGHLEI